MIESFLQIRIVPPTSLKERRSNRTCPWLEINGLSFSISFREHIRIIRELTDLYRKKSTKWLTFPHRYRLVNPSSCRILTILHRTQLGK